MLIRTDPYRDLDRFVQQVFGSPSRPASMPMDAYRKDESVLVHFDLPGVDASSIDLSVEKNVLAVKAERIRPTPDEGVEVVVSERPHGSFSRQLVLGDNLDADGIEAEYRDGVLTLSIPVAEKAKPRQITVRTADDLVVSSN
jgi:HSP20 family protein